MLDSERAHHLRRTEEHVGRLAKNYRTLVNQLRQMQGGYPSTLMGQITSRSMTSPVEAQLDRKDPARDSLSELESLVDRITRDAVRAYKIMLAWGITAPSPVVPPGCKVHESYGLGYEEVFRSGRCRFCYGVWCEFDHNNPTEALVKAKSEGQRMTRNLVESEMKAKRSA